MAIQAAPAAPAVIEVHTFMSSPNTLTVAAGTRVTWKNRDPEPHTVATGVTAGAPVRDCEPPTDARRRRTQ